MLKISQSLRTIFKRVFILLFVIELLILGAILLIYSYNTSKVKISMKQNVSVMLFDYRSLFIQYLRNKYMMLIDDMTLIMKTYESLDQWKLDSRNNDYFNKYTKDRINTECSIVGSSINDTSLYPSSWYNNSNSKISLDNQMKGTWYQGINIRSLDNLPLVDVNKLQNLCIMNDMLTQILTKSKRWQSIFSVTNEYYTFTYANSFFYKFPTFYNSYMTTWTDGNPSNCTNRIDYEPKCRPFYIHTTNSVSNVVINSPYRFATNGLFGSEICVKSITKISSTPNLVLCTTFNYNDLQLYRDQVEEVLISRRVFVFYYDGTNMVVIFSTDNSASSYKSYGQVLNINNNTENDLFEALYQTQFDNYVSKNGNNTSLLTEYYNNVNTFYQHNILTAIQTQLDNVSRDTNEVSFNETQSYIYDNTTNTISLVSKDSEYYIFPINLNFDYNDTYQISESNKSDFFILIVNESEETEKVNEFFQVILYEFLLYFCYIVFVNVLIWILFGIVYYYFFKGFLLPFKEINRLFTDLYFNKVIICRLIIESTNRRNK